MGPRYIRTNKIRQGALSIHRLEWQLFSLRHSVLTRLAYPQALCCTLRQWVESWTARTEELLLEEVPSRQELYNATIECPRTGFDPGTLSLMTFDAGICKTGLEWVIAVKWWYYLILINGLFNMKCQKTIISTRCWIAVSCFGLFSKLKIMKILKLQWGLKYQTL